MLRTFVEKQLSVLAGASTTSLVHKSGNYDGIDPSVIVATTYFYGCNTETNMKEARIGELHDRVDELNDMLSRSFKSHERKMRHHFKRSEQNTKRALEYARRPSRSHLNKNDYDNGYTPTNQNYSQQPAQQTQMSYNTYTNQYGNNGQNQDYNTSGHPYDAQHPYAAPSAGYQPYAHPPHYPDVTHTIPTNNSTDQWQQPQPYPYDEPYHSRPDQRRDDRYGYHRDTRRGSDSGRNRDRHYRRRHDDYREVDRRHHRSDRHTERGHHRSRDRHHHSSEHHSSRRHRPENSYETYKRRRSLDKRGHDRMPSYDDTNSFTGEDSQSAYDTDSNSDYTASYTDEDEGSQSGDGSSVYSDASEYDSYQ